MTDGSRELGKAELAARSPAELRSIFRAGGYRGDTWTLAPEFVHTAVVAVPMADAFDLLVFAQRNPKPCPVLEVTEPGSPLINHLAPGADVRTDLTGYRVFRGGECGETIDDVSHLWSDDMVAFMVGCTASFEAHIAKAGIRLRHLELGQLVPLYVTDRSCTPAGKMHGPLVVSMRPISGDQVARAVGLTSRFPLMHGSPIHVGDPAVLGIKALEDPDYGDAIEPLADEVPVFWGCSVTPQLVAIKSRLDFMITNAPNHMFISDLTTEQMATVP